MNETTNIKLTILYIIKVRAVFGILHASILHTFGEFMTSDCNIMLAIQYDCIYDGYI